MHSRLDGEPDSVVHSVLSRAFSLLTCYRDHFLKELEDMKDKSIATANRVR